MHNDEAVSKRWIEMVLSEKIHGDYLCALQDGTILCTLVNHLYRAVGKHIRVPIETHHSSPNTLFSTSCRRQNVRTFIESCRYFGVPDDAIFRPNDLLKASNPARVYSCILALQAESLRMARQRTPHERASMGTFAASSSRDFTETMSRVDDASSHLHPASTWGDTSMFTVESSSILAWTVLLELFETQQNEMYLSASHDGTPVHTDDKLSYELWRTEERVRMLVLEEASCRYLTPQMHGKLWMLLSGANTEMGLQKGHYTSLVNHSSVNAESVRQIEADLTRTVSPEDPEWTPDRIEKLRRVLVAYAVHNPKLGYCQGLNYVVARLLQCLDNDECVFWLLERMIAFLPDDYYTTMLGLAIDQHVFAELVALQSPEIVQHIEQLGGFGAELSLACTEWFCTLFGSPCRKDITLRVWDHFFINGNEALFRTALAFTQLEYPHIMSCQTYGDLLVCLNQIGRDALLDSKLLLHIANGQEIVTSSRIDDLRAYHRLELASGIALSNDRCQSTPTGVADDGPPLSNESATTKKRKHPLSNRKITSRTIPRHLSHEAIETKIDESAVAKYFTTAPQILDNYLGEAEPGPTSWQVDQFKLITSPSDASQQARPRQFSDTSYRHTFSDRTSSFREARSKSTTDGLRVHRASISNPPLAASSDDSIRPHFSNNIFKKIEAWTNKTLKKDRRHSTLNFEFLGAAMVGQASFFSGPRTPTPEPVIDGGMFPPSSRGSVVESARSSQLYGHVATPDMTIEPSLQSARAPPPAPIASLPPSPTFAEVSFSTAGSPTPSTQFHPIPVPPPISEGLVKRIVNSHSTPSLVSLEKSYHDDSCDSFDGGSLDDADLSSSSIESSSGMRYRFRSSPSSSSTTTIVRPPRHQRDGKKPPTTALMTIPDDLAPPDMRRHTSMPSRSRSKQVGRSTTSISQLNTENARLLRERAHVVSYLQRKASDVSSLNSPVDSDEYRGSLSSDEGTRRAHRATNRTNSFSFLGSLSVDLERSLLLEDKE
ncbi:hypothetical protein H310_05008 [Aphanomyces invadans]|uniref:Rab-GAP TBC domain-containing protein n=1 Tax=Aphanomyces invadans TaxID=157072 RepID=A0A024UBE3_9STRA|nr:hypothetical protein H310_05008 [Aphanomyces invadans]ETW03599.1 hypothetical protein H310_05008 [Aphanomyces invadans]|eukprot:XP_008867828.1 hypothetical protein H310_05008 [Aphanomyces invadans]